ncbi:hypothetical protein CVF65_23005, partial [Salmonella enterica]|nr:hypothetical protein [Salmonella enterica]EDV5787514.1 hypothetical protein [Salmonella enterica subsp. enterica serovar Thompson]EDW1506408.1 hypothetical protein [Salmonella enterica subsp. enterica serovar Thompson]EED9345139.1 hypothetical protein [Salmonella enterica subsp. enterica serovar Thompson]
MKWVWHGVWLLWRHVIPPSSWVNPGGLRPLCFSGGPMAGLTKEQRAQREAEKLAAQQAADKNPA